MKTNLLSTKIATCVVLLSMLGVLPARARTTTETQTVANKIEELVPAILAEKDQSQRDQDLRLMSRALARTGNLTAALHVASAVSKDEWQPSAPDEVWRITARRLAWQKNIAAATRCAHRIGSEYSRADALLAIERAQVRAGNKRAAIGLLNTVEPDIRKIFLPQAIAYFAWQFARVGQTIKARELFAHAKIVREPNQPTIPGWPDARPGAIAIYQAKSGFTADALKTVGKDSHLLSPVKAVLALKRDWQRFSNYAQTQTLTPAQEVNFLLELAGAQLKVGDKAAARQSWQLAKTRFDALPAPKTQTQDNFYLPFELALVEVLVGNEASGRARFSQIPFPPAIANEFEFAFHFFLVAAPSEIPYQSSPQQQHDDEKLAVSAMKQSSAKFNDVYNLLLIARAQKQRGDVSEMRETLELTKTRIRTDLVAPLKKYETLEVHRLNAAYQLLALAKFQRDAGESSVTESTLAQVMVLMKNNSRDNIAFALLGSGFVSEAATQLEALVSSPDKSTLEQIKNTTTNNWNPLVRMAAMHAKAADAKAALRWVMKIPDTSLRAQCLSAIAFALTPTPREESEFMLSGNKKSGAHFSAQIRFPGYNASYNSEELFD